MHTVKVSLLQSADDADMFTVTRFSGTASLSIGQEIPRTTLELWAGKSHFPRVDFTVIGKAEPSEGDLMKVDSDGGRINALNPF
jgi:hypothetical protein